MKKLISFRTFSKHCIEFYTSGNPPIVFCGLLKGGFTKCSEKNYPVFKKLKTAEVKR